MTAPTGRALTVITAVFDLPPLLAVIVMMPGEIPSTSPDDDTVAMALALLVHVISRPFSRAPVESRGLAVSCVACPSTTLSLAGVSCTVDIGTSDTVTPTAALRDSLVAVTVATPGAIPVTRPVTSTTATLASLDPQKTLRLSNVAPLSSRVRALSCTKPPTNRLGAVGVSCTLATPRAVTVTRAVALLPSTLAAIVADPVFTAVTRPADDTVATVVSLLDQETRRSEIARSASSRGVACRASVAPSLKLNCSIDRTTEPTGVSTGFGEVMSPRPLHAVDSAVAAISTSDRHVGHPVRRST